MKDGDTSTRHHTANLRSQQFGGRVSVALSKTEFRWILFVATTTGLTLLLYVSVRIILRV